jgi:hypothetical protein
VCGRFLAWATEADRALLSTRRWQAEVIDYRPEAGMGSLVIRSRRRAAAALVRLVGARRAPMWAVTRTYSYIHPELVRRALAMPADGFYGGTTGALAAVAEVASRAGKPYAIDLEDMHTSESEAPDAAEQHALARRVLDRVLPGARAVTTSSGVMAEAYRAQFGVEALITHNVVPLPPAPRFEAASDGPLRCYWFSQTIGAGRGLELFVQAAGLARVPLHLELRGRIVSEYVTALCADAARSAPLLVIDVQPPAPPDEMVARAAAHHVGLSLELPVVENRHAALSNKLFTYLAAGLAIAATATRAQAALAPELGHAIRLCAPDAPGELAAALVAWSADRQLLDRSRRAAWRAAATRWHWEHPSERDQLIAVLERAFR